ncbi:response regulator transcription factor EsaR, partial [Burkholderia multivorans]|nr:response regulator transcription factor EsaR [Burkholderia multivorans]
LEKPIALQKLLKAVEHGLARGAAPVSANAAAKAGAGQAAGPAAVASAAALPTLGDDVAAALGLAGQTAAIPFDIPLREARDAFERAYFEYHLARENGSMTRVAEKTGLERTHLYRKLKQLGVELGKKPSEGAA